MYFSSKNTEAAHFPKNTTQIGISFSYVHGHESYFFSVVYCVSFYNINYNIKGIPFGVIDIIAIIVWRPLLSPFNPFVVIILTQLKALYTAAKNNDNMFVCENACWPCVRQKSDWNTYGILLSHIRGSRCRHTCKNTHTQNKHSNPGLEKLSDDTAASITAKTFTLLFFNNPFIFLLSLLFILAFIFPLSWGRLSSETSSPQMVAVVYTPRVSTPKGTPDKTTFSIKMNESKVKRNRCTKKKLQRCLKREFFTYRLFVCGIFPAYSQPLWREAMTDNKGGKRQKEAEWGFHNWIPQSLKSISFHTSIPRAGQINGLKRLK